MEKRENIIRLIRYLVAKYGETADEMWMNIAVRQVNQLKKCKASTTSAEDLP